jgi:squalene-hopene/tetraprenyl-beta-curcumene cyclase
MRTLASVLVVLTALVSCSESSQAAAPAQLEVAAAKQGPPRAERASEPDLDLKDELDPSIAWLRGTQDAKNGSYGGGVEGTSWALRAYADCPRKYRRLDGPYVAKALDYLAAHQHSDGSIHDESAKGSQILEQSRAAVMALSRHADEATKPVLSKALAFVAKSGAEPAGADIQAPETRADAFKLAISMLAKRAADGSWDGPRGKVIETSRNVAILAAAYSLTQPLPSAQAPVARPLPRLEESDHGKALAALKSGASYLLSKSHDGQFDGKPGQVDAGFTALAIGALECVPEPRAKEMQAAIDAGLKWLVSLQKPDGSIHNGELANYVTSAAIMALARAGRAEYKPVIEKAQSFLITLQADEAEGYSPDNPYYGGNSYGDEQRPDLSNVQMALEALSASGLDKGNVAYKRALKFLERCQNRSESNDIRIADGDKVVVSGNDGGSAYAPGDSKAGFVEVDGKKIPRSYGSMTYALLKCYILCGLTKDDPRLKACFEWLRKNYTLDVNPGFEASSDPTAPYQGIYYYLHSMAKALAVYGEESIVDASGKANPWRKQLCGRLVAMQRKDGSWINENSPRWWEGNPMLATAWAVLSLDAAMPH